MNALNKVRKRIEEDQELVFKFEILERRLSQKDKKIADLEAKIIDLMDQLANAEGNLETDAQKIVDGEKKMPEGYYRETITKDSKFDYSHKKQA